MSKISVIIPVYNVEAYIKRCLDSVIHQSQALEIIVVNDGSTDQSRQIIETYKHHAQLKIIDKPNGGISSARNAGLAVAQGEYILFLDSDDMYLPGSIEALIPSLTDADIVFAKANQINLDKSETIIEHDLSEACSGIDYLKSHLPAGFPVMVWLNAYRKEFLDRHGLRFVEGLVHEDEEFMLKALLKAESVISAPIMLLAYILRPQSFTTSKRKRKSAVDLTQIAWDVVDLSPQYPPIQKGLLRHAVKLYIKAFRTEDVHKGNPKADFLSRWKMLWMPMSRSDRLKMLLIVAVPSLYRRLFSWKHDKNSGEDV
jgi:glycosyltransferase involved in cell wall biosynthesis